MKKILMTIGALVFASAVFAAENNNTLKPVYSARTTDGIKIYNTGCGTSATNALTIYVVGGATTSAASVTVFASSMSITTTGGLYPGTTYLIFTEAAKDTVTELANFITGISTYTPGFEGGVVCSTVTAAIGATASTNLTVTGATSCKGSANAATITATPASGQTATVTVHVSSISLITTNGLYPGTYQYKIDNSTETLTGLKAALDAIPSTTAGVDGTLVVTIPETTYELNLSSCLVAVAAQDIFGASAEKTLALDTTYGFRYLTDAGIHPYFETHLTGLVVNATFASGTTNLTIYDGTANTDTVLYKTPLTTATEKTLTLPPNGDFAGSRDTRLRIEVVGTAAITAGYLNIMGHKE